MNKYIDMLMNEFELEIGDKFFIGDFNKYTEDCYYFNKNGELLDKNNNVDNDALSSIFTKNLKITKMSKFPIMSEQELGVLKGLSIAEYEIIWIEDGISIKGNNGNFKRFSSDKLFKSLEEDTVYYIDELIKVNKLRYTKCDYIKALMNDLNLSEGEKFYIREYKNSPFRFSKGRLLDKDGGENCEILGLLVMGYVNVNIK